MIRTASAVWKGDLKRGVGYLNTELGALARTPYSASSRFADGKIGTNPEELLSAALAGCYAMALSAALEKNGFSPERIRIDAQAAFEKAGDEWEIARMELRARVRAFGLSEARLQLIGEDTLRHCPIGKVLRCEIRVFTQISIGAAETEFETIPERTDAADSSVAGIRWRDRPYLADSDSPLA